MPLKVGCIGMGGIAAAHMPNVAERRDTAIVAVCDPDRERLEEAAEKWGASAYGDYREMLEVEDLDAVYVCVPPAAHRGIELELAERGVPFCVEKPVHLDLSAGARVARAVREKGLVSCVGYQVRYTPQVQAAAGFLSERHISLVEGWFVGGMPPVPWWRHKKLSGGQAVEQTTDIFDLARRLAGEIKQVCAFGSTGAMTDIKGYDVEDASVALLQFESGAAGHVCSACVLNDGGAPHVGLRFDGLDYTVELTYSSLKIHTSEGTDERDHAGVVGPAMAKLDNAFLSAVESGDPSAIQSSYEDGLRSLAVSLAVNESMASGGKPVSPAAMLKAAGL